MFTRRRLVASAISLPVLAGLPGLARAADGPVVAAIRVTDQRVLIDVLLDGKGPFSFVIDTGAVVSGVREAVVQQVGLRKLRDVRLNAGKSFPLYAVDDLVLGGAVHQKDAALFGLEGPRLGGDGLLAAGLMTALDSELDFAAGEWRVWPTGSPDRTGFTRLASELREDPGVNGSRRIFADVTLGGVVLRPVFDTGMPWVLSLTHATGRKLGLWNDTTPYVPTRTSSIGGVAKSLARLVRGPLLQVGGETYPAPLVIVRPPDVAGPDEVLGLPLMRTLNLSVDRAAKAVWVRRNSLAVTETRYGGSGLWVEDDKGRVRVAEVGTGSPAAGAGVRVGDVLDVATVRDAIGLLGQPHGSVVSLKLKRQGGAADATFTLAAYL